MAIVTCQSCGRWLYRPDEMTGTAWQCIRCGPTKTKLDAADVPERLAHLLEEEYKRGVGNTIEPGSNSVSRDFTLITDPSAEGERPLPEEQGIASAPCPPPLPNAYGIEQKRLEIPEGSRTWWIAWIFAIPAVLLFLPMALGLVLLITKPSALKSLIANPPRIPEQVLVISIIAAMFAGIAVVYFLLAVRPIRRMQLRRILKSLGSPRSPNAKIEAAAAGDAYRNGERESRTNGPADQSEDLGQFRK